MGHRIDFVCFCSFVLLSLCACGGSTAMRSNEPAEPIEVQRPQYKTLSAGANHAFVLRTGELLGWGNNYQGKATAPETTGIQMISAGLNHSVALTEDGRVLAFGASRRKALAVPDNLHNVVQVVAAQDASVAVLESGELVMWGDDTKPPALAENVMEVEAGYDHFLAKLNDGRLLAWGGNEYGQVRLPNGITDQYGVKEIAAGRFHSLILRADGRVMAWGDNSRGQCDVPEFDQPVVDVEATYETSIALLSDGSLVAWGEPLPESAPADIVELEANHDQVLVRTAGGAIHRIASGRKVNLAALSNAIAASGDLVLGASGEVLPLFSDTPEIPADIPPDIAKIKGRAFPVSQVLHYNSIPVNLGESLRFAMPDANGDYWDDPVRLVNLALSNTGELFVWGDNRYGQLDKPDFDGPVTDADCGAWHCLAVLDDGKVWAWGRNLSGQTNVPDDLQDVVSVRAGASFSLALTDEGRVVVWGGDYYQELTLPDFHERVVDIFAYGYAGGAVLADGSGIVWRDGSNYHLTGDTAGSSALRSLVFHDPYRFVALNAGGDVLSWSRNGYVETLPNSEPVAYLDGVSGVYAQVDQHGNLSMWGGYQIPSVLRGILVP